MLNIEALPTGNQPQDDLFRSAYALQMSRVWASYQISGASPTDEAQHQPAAPATRPTLLPCSLSVDRSCGPQP